MLVPLKPPPCHEPAHAIFCRFTRIDDLLRWRPPRTAELVARSGQNIAVRAARGWALLGGWRRTGTGRAVRVVRASTSRRTGESFNRAGGRGRLPRAGAFRGGRADDQRSWRPWATRGRHAHEINQPLAEVYERRRAAAARRARDREDARDLDLLQSGPSESPHRGSAPAFTPQRSLAPVALTSGRGRARLVATAPCGRRLMPAGRSRARPRSGGAAGLPTVSAGHEWARVQTPGQRTRAPRSSAGRRGADRSRSRRRRGRAPGRGARRRPGVRRRTARVADCLNPRRRAREGYGSARAQVVARHAGAVELARSRPGLMRNAVLPHLARRSGSRASRPSRARGPAA